ncbi:hypothetical protein MSBR3_2969 [Methanosarcina barkeri 3]|uniref:Radical SAM core domain-containing protein n=1 Tax=Methanosarcina barkeri 3 TaxID=1434107 RepID=A0A0E3SPD0_METBA|nr:radical SAM protein [Methanosarcina barkeri]AKB83547.1 hypothetical protein MSBR3_2969 [Methanosarcina barkeri 3]
MYELNSIKKSLEDLKEKHKLDYSLIKAYAGSLIIKNPSLDIYQIKELLSLNEVVLNDFKPSEFEDNYIIIHKQNVAQTNEYVAFKNKLNNELEGVELDKVEKWLDQFPFFDWKIYGLKLLSETLYINEKNKDDNLKTILNFVSDPDKTVISDIKGLVKSSVNLFYGLNKFSKISVENIILSKDLEPNDDRDIVFIDDFIGSGNQATKYIKQLKREGKIDKQKLYLFAIVGLSEGIKRLEEEKLFSEVKVVHKIEHKAFDNSYIFSTSDAGKAKDVISNIGKQLTDEKMSLGYDNSQALVFFHNSSPNNSLPIFWAEGKCKILEGIDKESSEITWNPLFPRKEKGMHIYSENVTNITSEEKSYKNLKKIIKDINGNNEITDNITYILMKIIKEGNNTYIYDEKELSKFISEDDLKLDNRINKALYSNSLEWLGKTKNNYFVKYGIGYILKLNEFQQELKHYIFSKEEDADFTYILNKIDQDKKAVSYTSDSFNFLNTKKPEYEPYTLADKVQPNDTIRIMSYHYRYALTQDKIMNIFEKKLKQNVKIKIMLMHPYSPHIRLPQTRNEIIQATSNLIDIAIKERSRHLEVRYYGKKLVDDQQNESKNFLFRGHIYGNEAIAFVPFPSKRSNGTVLGDPYYLTWDKQNVFVFINKDNDSLLNIIELYQNYFDDIWYDSSTLINEFLEEEMINGIDNKLISQLSDKFKSYNELKNITNWYENNENIVSDIKNKELVQIEIHPTNKCNLICSFCFYKDRRIYQEMNTSTLERIIDDVYKYGKRIIFSGGGEPTYYSDIESIIKKCKEYKLPIGIITNGYFDKSFIDCIYRNFEKDDFIRFSIDAGSSKNFNNIKGIRGNGDIYNKILNNIKTISEYNNRHFEVSIGYAVGSKNCDLSEIFSFLDFLRRNIKSDIKIMFRPIIDIPEEELFSSESLNNEQIDMLLNNIFEIERKIPIEVKHNLSDFVLRLETLKNTRNYGIIRNSNTNENRCYIAYSAPIIEPDGNIFLCHISSKLWRINKDSPGSLIGYSVENPIGQIINNRNFSDIWDDFKNKPNNKYYYCNNSKLCNPRDLLLNKKMNRNYVLQMQNQPP